MRQHIWLAIAIIIYGMQFPAYGDVFVIVANAGKTEVLKEISIDQNQVISVMLSPGQGTRIRSPKSDEVVRLDVSANTGTSIATGKWVYVIFRGDSEAPTVGVLEDPSVLPDEIAKTEVTADLRVASFSAVSVN